MPLILAIEPDRRQAARIAALTRGQLNAELLVTESTEHAIAALANRVPDLILTSLLLSPKDESRLRELDRAGRHVPTLMIPMLATPARRSRERPGLLKRLPWSRATPASTGDTEGCEPAVFAAQIAEYLDRAALDRAALDREGSPSTTPAEGVRVAAPEEKERATATMEAATVLEEPIRPQPEPIETERIAITQAPTATEVLEATETRAASEAVAVGDVPAAEVVAAADRPTAAEVVAAPELPVAAEAVRTSQAPAASQAAAAAEVLTKTETFAEPELLRATDVLAEEFLAEAETKTETFAEPEVLRATDALAEEFLAEDEILAEAEASWDELAFRDEESAPAIELSAETIDLRAFVKELEATMTAEIIAVRHGPAVDAQQALEAAMEIETIRDSSVRISARANAHPLPAPTYWPALEGLLADETADEDIIEMVADFVAALEADTEPFEDEPESAWNSDPDSDLWMPLSANVGAAWPRLESTCSQSRMKQDEWGFFDPEQCGFAALLAKLDQMTK